MTEQSARSGDTEPFWWQRNNAEQKSEPTSQHIKAAGENSAQTSAS